ncbi:MAG TPA: hypothetical protein EYP55_04195 [Anaerolineae bacterium]|nr:hypothetical protein [Anaerolineae bacterium]
MHVLVEVAVSGPHEPIPLAGDKIADADVLAGLRRAAVQVEAGIVYFAGRLPLQEHLTVAGRGGEADQGDHRLGGDGCAQKH